MSDKNLSIVGNGFDVNHGLPSSYANFKDWLKTNDSDLFKFLDIYIDVKGDWWNDFESNLSEINIPQLIKDTPLNKLQPQIIGLPPSFSHPASWKLDNIHEMISKRFTEWVQTLDGVIVKNTINMPEASLYISFNYTDTLERVYGINEESILYIHGKASRGDKLIFGHGKNQYILKRDIKEKYGFYESNDFYKAGTYGDREYQLTMRTSFMEKEPYNQLVRYNEVLKPAIRRAEMVWVYGLSFSEVDFPYIGWIVEQNRSLHWRASWHTEKDKIRIMNTFAALNVEEYEMFYM